MANPAMPCSHRGVLKTLSAPNCSFSPTLQRNTPPNATSYKTGHYQPTVRGSDSQLTSPKTAAVSSVSNAILMASFNAVNKFIFLVSTSEVDIRRIGELQSSSQQQCYEKSKQNIYIYILQCHLAFSVQSALKSYASYMQRDIDIDIWINNITKI